MPRIRRFPKKVSPNRMIVSGCVVIRPASVNAPRLGVLYSAALLTRQAVNLGRVSEKDEPTRQGLSLTSSNDMDG
jgi:hypothetical protein